MWRRACGSSEDRTALIKAAPRAKHAGAFLSADLAAAAGEPGGDIPPQEAENAACHQGEEGAAQGRADVQPHAGGGRRGR